MKKIMFIIALIGISSCSRSAKVTLVDENGYSFKGTREEARQKKYQWDLQQAKLKQKDAQEKAQYNGSLKKKIDDTGKDIEKAAKYVSKVSKDTVDKGKKFLAGLFD